MMRDLFYGVERTGQGKHRMEMRGSVECCPLAGACHGWLFVECF